MTSSPPPETPSGNPADARAADVPARPDEGVTRARSSRLQFPVAGIGASAGGLEALEALTQRLVPDRMAFVVIQHLAPAHVSMLADILNRGTPLRVATIEYGMRLDPGVVYVAPPNVEVSLEGDELRVVAPDDASGRRHGIDAFFRSLARAAGPMAIGVVLSGSGTDGTLGLKAIKEEGGITFAQDPSTAAQPSMPQSALDAGVADFALTPAEIGLELVRLSAHPYVRSTPPAQFVDADSAEKVFGQLRVAFGVDFGLYKQNTIERRIARRMALHKIGGMAEYQTLLAADAHELRSLYNDLLIGVTNFFRDAEPFDALKEVVFPRLFENRPSDVPVRIWVAGCSTGEEAYSIAIALLEYLGDRAGAYRIQIFATDVDDSALARARAGAYPPNIELDVSAKRLRRFFTRTDKGYQVVRNVRDLVVFARHNLGKDPPFSRLDLVTCRNVLIYLQGALQKKVMRIFHYALNPDAYLLLGTSESVGDAADLFSLLDRKLKVYAKKNIPASAVFEFSFAAGRSAADDGAMGGALEARPIAGMAQIADRKVIEKYGPPGVIVDERLDVVQFRGRLGPYLEPAPGAATLNVLKLARPELLMVLRTVLNRTLSEGVAATSPVTPLRTEAGLRAVVLEIIPLVDTGGRRSLLVLFNDVTHATAATPSAEDGRRVDDDPRVIALQRELTSNKEYLQSTIEELEASNEELQSANEELQSSNEELQSTNEELETSKEELQSTNEELATVNDELHRRMGQLSVANDDLQNVLLNGNLALVMVGPDFHIRRFSSAAEKLLGLIPADIGRPVTYLRNMISGRDIERVAADAVASVASRELRVRCLDGSWYMMKLVPYVTADQIIRGLVLEFVKAAPPAPTADDDPLEPSAAQALSLVPQPLVVIDRRLQLVWANRALFETFAVGPASLGRPIAEAWGHSSEPPELWIFLEDLVEGRSPRDILVEHPFARTSEQPVRLTGRVLPSEAERAALAVVFIVAV
jgi:two-component system, chemotaxis family, CheB/CheR fusion protein